MQTIEKVMNTSFFLPNDGNSPITVLCAGIILSIIVLGVSLPLNVYVFWLFVTGVRNEVRSEFFSLNLFICQILVCLSALLGLFNYIVYKNFMNSPLSPFIFFCFILHCISRSFFQGCICVERFVAVNHPIIFLKYKPLRYRIAFSLVAWIIFLGFSVFCPYLPIRNTLRYIVLPEYMLLFSIKILCSIAVLKALRKPRPGEKLNKKDVESNCMKKKAFGVIMIILVCMFITYCPVIILIFIIGYLSDAEQLMYLTILSYFVIFGGLVDPFLYLHRVGKLPFISGLWFCSNYKE